MVSGGNVAAPMGGVTVVDLSSLLPGPYAGFLLAQLGARVIKVESLNGDPMRSNDPAAYEVVNAGKESIAIDLKDPAAVSVIDSLFAQADVVLVSSLPATLARLGIGPERVHAIDPTIIYCHVLGWGGEMRDQPAHDVDVLAASGAIFLGPQSAYPLGMPFADLATGAMAALGIVSGLRDLGMHRVLEVSMSGVLETWVAIGAGLGTREAVENPKGPPQIGGYGIFGGSDGRELSLGAVEDRFWRVVVELLGLDPVLGEIDLDERRERADKLNADVASVIGSAPAGEWVERFRAAGLPSSLVASPYEAFTSDRSSGPVEVRGERVSVSFPVPTFACRLERAPFLGEHTTRIMGWLGLEDDLEDLRADGVVP